MTNEAVIHKFNGVLNDPSLPYIDELRFNIYNGTKTASSHKIKIGIKSEATLSTDNNHVFYVDGSETGVHSYTLQDNSTHIIETENADYNILLRPKNQLNTLSIDFANISGICWGMDVDGLALAGVPFYSVNLAFLSHVRGMVKSLANNVYSFIINSSNAGVDLPSIKDIAFSSLHDLGLASTNSLGTLSDLAVIAQNNSILGGAVNLRYTTISGNLEAFAASLVGTRTNALTLLLQGSSVVLPEGITDKAVIRFDSSYPDGYQISES